MWEEDEAGKKYWVAPLSYSGCLGLLILTAVSGTVAIGACKLIIKGAVIAWKLIF